MLRCFTYFKPKARFIVFTLETERISERDASSLWSLCGLQEHSGRSLCASEKFPGIGWDERASLGRRWVLLGDHWGVPGERWGCLGGWESSGEVLGGLGRSQGALEIPWGVLGEVRESM